MSSITTRSEREALQPALQNPIAALQEEIFIAQTALSQLANQFSSTHQETQRKQSVWNDHVDNAVQLYERYRQLLLNVQRNRIDKLTYRIAFAANKKHEIYYKIVRLKDYQEILNVRLAVLQQQEKSLYRALKGVPTAKVTDMILCPISGKFMIDAIRFPKGALLSAASLGLKIENSTVIFDLEQSQIQTIFNKPEISRVILDNCSIPEPIGDFFSNNQESFHNFLSRFEIDYKVAEIAEGFASQEGNTILDRSLVEDPVTSRLYREPLVLSCGHTVSRCVINNREECFCRAKITSQKVNLIVRAFVSEYESLQPREIMESRVEEIQQALAQIMPTKARIAQLTQECEKEKEYVELVRRAAQHNVPLGYTPRNAGYDLATKHKELLDATQLLTEIESSREAMQTELGHLQGLLSQMPEECLDIPFDKINERLDLLRKKKSDYEKRLTKANERLNICEKRYKKSKELLKKLPNSTIKEDLSSQAKRRLGLAIEEFQKSYDNSKESEKLRNGLIARMQEESDKINTAKKKLLLIINQLDD